MVKILLLGLSGDSGCQVAAVGLHDKLLKILMGNELVYAPTLIDVKEIPEKIDVAIIEGGLRTKHEVEVIKKIRSNSKLRSKLKIEQYQQLQHYRLAYPLSFFSSLFCYRSNFQFCLSICLTFIHLQVCVKGL